MKTEERVLSCVPWLLAIDRSYNFFVHVTKTSFDRPLWKGLDMRLRQACETTCSPHSKDRRRQWIIWKYACVQNVLKQWYDTMYAHNCNGVIKQKIMDRRVFNYKHGLVWCVNGFDDDDDCVNGGLTTTFKIRWFTTFGSRPTFGSRQQTLFFI